MLLFFYFLYCHLKDFCWLSYKAECLLQHTEDSIMPPACQTKLILWTGSKPHWQLATIHQKLKQWGDENKRDSICINKHGTLPEWWRYSGNTLSSSPWSAPGGIQRERILKKGVNEYRQEREDGHFVMSGHFRINSTVRTNNAKEVHKGFFISKEKRKAALMSTHRQFLISPAGP